MDYISNYKIDESILLGEGGFAKVYRAVWIQSNEEVAIKIISRAELNASGVTAARIEDEISIQQPLNCSHVVKFHNAFADDSYIYIVLELCNEGNLYDHLQHIKSLRDGNAFTEPEVIYFVGQILKGLHYLHVRSIVHRDLKLSNILLHTDVHDNLTIKLCDFGFAFIKQHPDQENTTVCGTPHYVSPEAAAGRSNQSSAIDIWAVGVVFYYLLTGFPPFDKDAIDSAAAGRKESIVYKEPPEEILSPEGRDFLRMMLQKDPSKRPSARSALKHPVFQQDNDEVSILSLGSQMSAGLRNHRSGGHRRAAGGQRNTSQELLLDDRERVSRNLFGSRQSVDEASTRQQHQQKPGLMLPVMQFSEVEPSQTKRHTSNNNGSSLNNQNRSGRSSSDKNSKHSEGSREGGDSGSVERDRTVEWTRSEMRRLQQQRDELQRQIEETQGLTHSQSGGALSAGDQQFKALPPSPSVQHSGDAQPTCTVSAQSTSSPMGVRRSSAYFAAEVESVYTHTSSGEQRISQQRSSDSRQMDTTPTNTHMRSHAQQSHMFTTQTIKHKTGDVNVREYEEPSSLRRSYNIKESDRGGGSTRNINSNLSEMRHSFPQQQRQQQYQQQQQQQQQHSQHSHTCAHKPTSADLSESENSSIYMHRAPPPPPVAPIRRDSRHLTSAPPHSMPHKSVDNINSQRQSIPDQKQAEENTTDTATTVVAASKPNPTTVMSKSMVGCCEQWSIIARVADRLQPLSLVTHQQELVVVTRTDDNQLCHSDFGNIDILYFYPSSTSSDSSRGDSGAVYSCLSLTAVDVQKLLLSLSYDSSRTARVATDIFASLVLRLTELDSTASQTVHAEMQRQLLTQSSVHVERMRLLKALRAPRFTGSSSTSTSTSSSTAELIAGIVYEVADTSQALSALTQCSAKDHGTQALLTLAEVINGDRLLTTRPTAPALDLLMQATVERLTRLGLLMYEAASWEPRLTLYYSPTPRQQPQTALRIDRTAEITRILSTVADEHSFMAQTDIDFLLHCSCRDDTDSDTDSDGSSATKSTPLSFGSASQVGAKFELMSNDADLPMFHARWADDTVLMLNLRTSHVVIHSPAAITEEAIAVTGAVAVAGESVSDATTHIASDLNRDRHDTETRPEPTSSSSIIGASALTGRQNPGVRWEGYLHSNHNGRGNGRDEPHSNGRNGSQVLDSTVPPHFIEYILVAQRAADYCLKDEARYIAVDGKGGGGVRRLAGTGRVITANSLL